MALALAGLGASALAPATADPGGHGEWHHQSATLDLDRNRCRECRRNSGAEPSAPMRLDRDRVANAVDAGEDRRVRIEAAPAWVMSALVPLRGAHYTRLCRLRGHLCDLFAAHVRARTARIGPQEARAPESTQPGRPARGEHNAPVKAPPSSLRSSGRSESRGLPGA